MHGDYWHDRVGLRWNCRHRHCPILADAENTQRRIDARWITQDAPCASAVAGGTGEVESLRKPDTQCRDDHALHRILPIIDNRESSADHCPARAKKPSSQAGIARRRPCKSHAGRDVAIVHVEYTSFGRVDGHKPESGIKELAVVGGIFPLLQELQRSNGFAGPGINLDGLAAQAFDGSRLPTVT